MAADEKRSAQQALAIALAGDILFVGGVALGWAREFLLSVPLRLSGLLILAGLVLAVVSGVKLLLIANGAPGWWRRAGGIFGATLILNGLPPVVLLAWAVYCRMA